jgi:hypothetical protein
MYGVGGALAAWAGGSGVAGLAWGSPGSSWRWAPWTSCVRPLLATRDGDVWDWVADAAGAIFFYLLTVRILRRR